MDIDLWTYRARPTRVVDGDTIKVLVDLGMRVYTEVSLRLEDIDTAEIFRGTDAEKAEGQEAKAFVQQWLDTRATSDWPLLIRTDRDRRSFNRYVAQVWSAETGDSLGAAVVDAGYSEPG